jgi:hypothetical protein
MNTNKKEWKNTQNKVEDMTQYDLGLYEIERMIGRIKDSAEATLLPFDFRCTSKSDFNNMIACFIAQVQRQLDAIASILNDEMTEEGE